MDILRFFARNRVIITQLKQKKKKWKNILGFFVFCVVLLCRIVRFCGVQCQLCHNPNLAITPNFVIFSISEIPHIQAIALLKNNANFGITKYLKNCYNIAHRLQIPPRNLQTTLTPKV